MGQDYPVRPASPFRKCETLAGYTAGGLFSLSLLLLGGCADEPAVGRAAGEICSTYGVPADAPGHALCAEAVSPSMAMQFAEANYSARRAEGEHLAALCFNIEESVSGGSKTCAYRCLAPTRTETRTIPSTQQCQPAITFDARL